MSSSNVLDSCDNDDYETLYYASESVGQNMEGFHSFYNSDKAINVYLANQINGMFGLSYFSAWASFPWSGNHSYITEYTDYNSKIHVHEMGHLLGLLHTHNPGELVDGSNCSTQGDLCCDTPAEPNLRSLVDGDCMYTGSEVDIAGQLYTPEIGNHMSYASSRCNSYFTPDQVERMEYFHFYYMNKYQCIDDYEYTDVVFDEIITSPFPAVEGEPYSIIVNARNLGNTKAEDIRLELSLDDNLIARRTIFTMFPTNPSFLWISDREEFPHEAGRYLICVETEGDSLEVNPLNNRLCQEILVRQRAGIPDLSVGELSHPGVSGQQNSLNPLSFELENVGSIVAEEVSGKVHVNEILVDSFALADIEVGARINVNLHIPLGFDSHSDVCIELDPAFAEERIANNKACIQYRGESDLRVDLEVDSIALSPDDSLLVAEKLYKVYYRNLSNGPNVAWDASSYLRVNAEVIDSTLFGSNWGWSVGYTSVDSFEFVVPTGISGFEVCAELRNYRDTFPDNNILCLSRPVDQASSLEAVSALSKLNIYPNPVDQILSIDSDGLIRRISIYNSVGSHLVSIDNIESKSRLIDFSLFNSGVYHLVIETDNGSLNRIVAKL
ncbi:MAG: CARDB domain-containing protein [Saprospiraceae bacterium]